MEIPVKYVDTPKRVDVRIDSLIKEIEIYDNSLHSTNQGS